MNCIVSKSLYEETQTGLRLFLVTDENGNEITVSGKLPYYMKRLPLEIEGTVRSSQRGDIFYAKKIELGRCSTYEELFVLMSGLKVSISPDEVKKLFAYQEDLISLAEKDEKELHEFTAVPVATLMEVLEALREIVQKFELFKLLSRTREENLAACVTRICRKHPDDAYKWVINDPYQLLDIVSTMRFTTPDELFVRQLGGGIMDARRINALVKWGAGKIRGQGNVCFTLEKLKRTIASMASRFGDAQIPDGILVKSLMFNSIYEDPDFRGYFYEKEMAETEKAAAKEVFRLQSSAAQMPWRPELIDRIEKEIREELKNPDYRFGNQQRQAFQLLTEMCICILNGDPGTGKTTTLKAMLMYLEDVYKETFNKEPVVLQMAPSGRAAQRMSESTGRAASTIHKALAFQRNEDGGYVCREEMLEADIVVVDEVSMLGLEIFAKLLSVVKDGAMVILIGDPNQLPSVDTGNVLSDLLGCGYISYCHLTELFRQGKDSLIALNAKNIINGTKTTVSGADFSFTRTSAEGGNGSLCTAEVLEEKIKHLLSTGVDANDIQVLCPVRKGSTGVEECNRLLQKLLLKRNGSAKLTISRGITYYVGDRVIFETNNYRAGYFNGDIGYITAIRNNKISVQIADTLVELSSYNFCDMSLAYAVTIHKSQGSEYPHAVIVLQKESAGLLDRNLVYTAVTRGKKSVTLLCEDDTYEKSVSTQKNIRRGSMLGARIELLAQKDAVQVV